MRCITGTAYKFRNIVGYVSEFCPIDGSDFLITADGYYVRDAEGKYIRTKHN